MLMTLNDDGRMVTLTGDNKGGDTDPGGNRMLTMMLVITDTHTDPDDSRMLTLTLVTTVILTLTLRTAGC